MRWEDLKKELGSIPGYRESFELHYPYHDVSLAIAGVRSDLDMTQNEFGALVGIPQSTVARLESGRQNPSVGMLQRIARATGTELVIEFRPRARTRRPAGRRTRAASTGAVSISARAPKGDPIAASSHDS
jgi:transcriptional regulator with XRE-family HTH domain